MANQEHLDKLNEGVAAWNQWRKEHPEIQPDLSLTNLREVDLSGAFLMGASLMNSNLTLANLSHANLWGAKLFGSKFHSANLFKAGLRSANLICADFSHANLRGANLWYVILGNLEAGFASFKDADLSDTDLNRVDFDRVNLSGAKFNNALLVGTKFDNADLSGADYAHAEMLGTSFGDRDLRVIKGLESVQHRGPSPLSINTLYLSGGDIPEGFLRGTGAPDSFVEYIRALTNSPIQYYTCFMSYSNKDQVFAKRLYADLQSHNVRCWFAPEAMKIGDKIRVHIDESIRSYDKLLIVLSEHSVASEWVEHEVETALDKEREDKPNVLFPVRIDETIMSKKVGWANHIRNTRHIGDFTQWKDDDEYQQAFTRLLRDLKAQSQ